jgi:hypothetical protein
MVLKLKYVRKLSKRDIYLVHLEAINFLNNKITQNAGRLGIYVYLFFVHHLTPINFQCAHVETSDWLPPPPPPLTCHLLHGQTRNRI